MAKSKSRSKKQPNRQPKRQLKSQPKQTVWQQVLENKTRILVVLALIILPTAIILSKSNSNSNSEQQAQAQQENKEEAGTAAENSPEDAKTAAAGAYDYVAQPGDSYSKMTRKAIQTYGINNGVSLSQAQIIYAETMLTRQAGSPELKVGQKVNIKESVVKDWVEKAGQLSEAKKKAWAAYTAGVNFNTNNVGVAR